MIVSRNLNQDLFQDFLQQGKEMWKRFDVDHDGFTVQDSCRHGYWNGAVSYRTIPFIFPQGSHSEHEYSVNCSEKSKECVITWLLSHP